LTLNLEILIVKSSSCRWDFWDCPESQRQAPTSFTSRATLMSTKKFLKKHQCIKLQTDLSILLPKYVLSNKWQDLNNE
jgi:hypothetical protein